MRHSGNISNAQHQRDGHWWWLLLVSGEEKRARQGIQKFIRMVLDMFQMKKKENSFN